MNDTLHVKGLSQLNAYLDTFEPKLRKNIMRGALRAGVKVIVPVAKANIKSVSGELAKGLKIDSRTKGTMVRAYMKATGIHAPLAHLIEYGVRAHTIAAKKGGKLKFAGGYYTSVDHPGFAPYGDRSIIGPHAFARPALDQQSRAAVIATGEYIKKRLAQKHGIDTGDVEVGEE